MDPVLFGSRLRLARERRRLTLRDLASRTKLHASLFETLEEGTCRGWPVGVYSRSHVRTYAELVGLDPAEVVEEFSALFPHLAWSEQDKAHDVAAVLRPHSLRPRAGTPSAPLRLVLAEERVPFWRVFLTRLAWLLHRLANGSPPAPEPIDFDPELEQPPEQGEAAALVPFTGWQVNR